MKNPILFRRDDLLTHEQALYWKDLLYRTVKVGTEIEFAMPKGMRKKEFLPELIDRLHPSQDLNNLGQYGVLDVISEHCGIEVQVIGRQPYYRALLKQFRELFALLPQGIRARPTCGLHYHLLTVGLSEPVPEIILANIWNLTRRYAPYLRFLTSAGAKPESLCRRRNHTSHLELVRHTPGVYSMQEIQQLLHNSEAVPKHQNFLNLEHLTFTRDGAVKDFHVEFRFPDADLSPTSIVAKTFLFLAMLLKSVEMSQYGVIHAGKFREWKRKKALLDMLSNNDGATATSDTSKVTPEVIEELRAGGRELMALLKPIFKRLEHNPSFDILASIVEEPLSLRRIQGYSWPEIEAQLAQHAELQKPEWDKTDKRVMRVIELAEYTDYAEHEGWKRDVADALLLTPEELEQRLEKITSFREMYWDAQLGAFAFLN